MYIVYIRSLCMYGLFDFWNMQSFAFSADYEGFFDFLLERQLLKELFDTPTARVRDECHKYLFKQHIFVYSSFKGENYVKC